MRCPLPLCLLVLLGEALHPSRACQRTQAHLNSPMSDTPELLADDPTVDLEEAARHLEAYLSCLGFDPKERAQTAARASQLMADWTRGQRERLRPPTLIPATSREQWVAIRGLHFYSFCEHHLVPFFGQVDLVFLPEAQIIGFGSALRIVEHYARRPQLQERLTEEIASSLTSFLKPQGLVVRLSARQLCVELQDYGKIMESVTLSARGICKEASSRAEALALMTHGA